MSKHTPGLFKSADGGVRCRGCHLHPDTCTCRLDHLIWRLIALLDPQEHAIAKTEEV